MRNTYAAATEFQKPDRVSSAHRLMLQTLSPVLLDWCEPLQSRSVLELGCGEGDLARMFGARGSGRVIAIDRSEHAIRAARSRTFENGCNVEFVHADPTDLSRDESASWDVVAIALTLDGLGRDATRDVLREAMRVLRVGGRLVFAVLHPFRPFLRTVPKTAWPNADSVGYESGRDHMLFGRLAPFEDSDLSIPYVHKTLGDYFHMLRDIGVETNPDVCEIVVDDEMIAADPEFLAPHRDHPLFMVIRVHKTS